METLSIVVPYYNQEEVLEWFLAPILEIKSNLFELVLVDDHSQFPVPLKMLKTLDMSVKVIRVESRVEWGMTGASNWGVAFATGKRILKLDIDHRISEADLFRCSTIALERGDLFRFPRYLAAKKPLDSVRYLATPHSNSFLILRDSFLEAGLYDERFAGHYGYDDKDFFRRIDGKFNVRVEESIALETDTAFRTPGQRSRSFNRLRFKLSHSRVTPKRLLRKASVVFTKTL